MKNLLKIEFTVNNREWHQNQCLENLDLGINVNLIMCMDDSYQRETTKNNLFKITDEEYTPVDKDKLFFLPAVSVPRIKLKDLATKRGIKTTRDITTANAIFASNRTVHKLTDYNWYNVYSTADFKLFFEATKEYIEVQDIASIETALEFYTEDIILTGHLGNKVMCSNASPHQLIEPSEGTIRFLYFKDDYFDLAECLLKGGLCNIYDESEILKHVNGSDCVTIDVDMYKNLSEMFDSDDTDNHTLAMEIMANCNYTDSLLFLEMLFMDYGNTMYYRDSRNHVNFKGLLSYLDKDSRNMSTNIDEAMKSLREKGKMTKENVQTLLMHQCGKTLSIYGSHEYFSIKSISLKPEYLEEIGDDLDFKIQPDFTPAIQEEEIKEATEDEASEQLHGVDNTGGLEYEAEKMIASQEESPLDEGIIAESQEEQQYDL